MVDFGEAIKRPFSDFKKLSIGAVMYMIPFVNIITGLFSYGYELKCAKGSMANKFELPRWTDFGGLWVKGFLAAIISLIYFIPALIIGLIFGGATLLTALSRTLVSPGEMTSIFSLIGGGIATIVTVSLIALLTAYVLPMAIMMFVDKNNFGASFKLGTVFRKAFTGKYLGTWLIALIYTIVISAVGVALAALLSVTVVLPYIITGFVGIITGISVMSMFGEVYSEIK